MKLKLLIGSGGKIMLFTLPFLIVGLVANIQNPGLFSLGGPSSFLLVISYAVLLAGLINWAWSVYLILKLVPQQKLITTGPYSWVKHPLYTGLSFLVLPWIGVLFNSWLGLFIAIILYIGNKLYSREEEMKMSQVFGGDWEEYCKTVKITWL